MPEDNSDLTSGREPEIRSKRRLPPWKPIRDEFYLSPPVDWVCPCGTMLVGTKSCPKCGRVPMDHAARPKPEPIRLRQWRKFCKQYK